MKSCIFPALVLPLAISVFTAGIPEAPACGECETEPIFSRSVRLDFSSGSSELLFPVKLGDKAFVPLEPVCRKLGFKLEVRENGEFSLKTDKGIICGRAGSIEVAVDGKNQQLPLPVMKIENQIFVPEHFVTECMAIEMHYSSETQEMIIQKNR